MGGRGVHRQTERQTDLEEKTSERVMKWETGRRGEKEINARRENTHPEFSLNQKFVFWWSIGKWKKMAASYKDLINFEGSSAPLVQGRVQEGGRETDPWAD